MAKKNLVNWSDCMPLSVTTNMTITFWTASVTALKYEPTVTTTVCFPHGKTETGKTAYASANT